MSNTLGNIKPETQERAVESVKAFRRMIPTLNAYARAISGNPKTTIRVTGSVPRTDGTIIYLPPPIALGDKTPHMGRECGDRGEDGRKVCPACRVRESVFVNIVHELSHIVFGSFEGGNPKAIAAGENDYLPHIFNALEDSRVDTAMFKARPGVRPMMQADIAALLAGEEFKDDERYVPIGQAPLVSQLNVALYLQAAGYGNWKHYFASKIVNDMEDALLLEILSDAPTADSAAQVLTLSRRAYKRLVSLGYYEQPEQEQDNDGTEAGEDSDDSSGGPSEGEPSSTDSGAGCDADTDAGRNDAGDQSGSVESTDSDDEAGDPADQDADGSISSGKECDQRGDQQDSDEPPTDSDSGAADVDRQQPLGGSQVGPEDVADDSSDPDVGDESDEGVSGAGQDRDDRDPGSEDGDGEGDVQEAESGTDSDDGEPSGGTDGAERTDDRSSSQRAHADSEAAHGEADERPDDEGNGSGQAATDGSDDRPQHEGDAELEDSSEDSGHEGDADPVELPQDGGPAPGEPSSNGGDRGGSPESGEEDREPVDHGLLGEDEPVGSEGDPEEGDQGAEGSTEAEAGTEEAGEVLETPDGEGVRTQDVPRMGDADDAKAAMETVHTEKIGMASEADYDDEEGLAVAVAVVQGDYFETPSAEVVEVNEYRYGDEVPGWITGGVSVETQRSVGIVCDMEIPESVIGGNLLRTRRIFTDNVTRGIASNRRSGRVDPRKLGRRAWIDGEDRLFAKRLTPSKKSYAVQVLMDVSSSNNGTTLALLKRSVMAQAELMHRVGIDFAITAHTGSGKRLTPELGGDIVYCLNFHHVREWGSPWDNYSKNALGSLAGFHGNLDGHALEFGRKQVMNQDVTDRIILYYTDGKMPAANHDEELEVLQAQIRHCKRDGIVLLGVGMGTDSPVQHGLDTVVVNDDDDLRAVVDHLGKRLGTATR